MVVTPATVYAEDDDAVHRLVRAVPIEDRPIEPAIEDARDRLNERLREGRRLAGRIEG